MDIQIVHNGVQMGPFTEETAHALLKSGSVLVNDLAWRPGLPDWVPLMNLLYPAAVTPAPPVSAAKVVTPAPEPREPATAKQKAFLAYLHIGFAPEITREDASRLVNDTMENPKDPARLARWNEERLQLHPELFAAELQTKKEHRPPAFPRALSHGRRTLFRESDQGALPGAGQPSGRAFAELGCPRTRRHLEVFLPGDG